MTSQIFANIYLNEFDRFVVHTLGVKGYVRYGDDFIIFESDQEKLAQFRVLARDFLEHFLGLQTNPRHDILLPVKQGVHFLGMELFISGQRLNSAAHRRIRSHLTQKNSSSYAGLIARAEPDKIKYFNWLLLSTYEF
ncbi:MAG: RNA-directed DNA polymerase [Candidatus Magasanikbacteria bacterium]|nr:RNA-directed DNA polymerase [Candidatus Magasanikbacteria bacterium]